MGSPIAPRQLFAVCHREEAAALVKYDHHRVRVQGKLAILLTYHWLPLEEAPDPLHVIAVFHDAAHQHPPVPPHVQTMVDVLTFTTMR